MILCKIGCEICRLFARWKSPFEYDPKANAFERFNFESGDDNLEKSSDQQLKIFQTCRGISRCDAACVDLKDRIAAIINLHDLVIWLDHIGL